MSGRDPAVHSSHLRRLAGFALASAFAFAPPSAAQEPVDAVRDAEGAVWGFELQIPMLSQYVFRGLVLNDEAVLQPEAFGFREWENGAWLGAGAFANVELTDYSNRSGQVTEWDWFVEGTIPTAAGGLSAGCYAYTYPNESLDATVEAFLAWEVAVGALTPRVEVWYDFVEGDGFYGRARLAYELPLGESWTLAAETGLGAMDDDYAAYNFGVAASGLADLAASVRLAWTCGEATEIACTLLGSSLLDEEYRDAVDDPDPLWLAITWGIAL
jgi:hypothetical protein